MLMMKLIELNKLFSFSHGNKMDLNKMTIVPRDSKFAAAFVARIRNNNGIVSYVERRADIQPYKEGHITVALGGSVLSSFLQTEAFYTAQNIAVLAPLCEMTEQQKLYYCISIYRNAFRYSTCGREANTTLKYLKVPDISEIPEYVTKTEIFDYSDFKKSCTNEKINLSADKWGKFRYDKIFDIKKGKRVTRLDLGPGSTPFISATDENNGIREYTGLVHLFPANTITVSYNGSVGEAFFQERPFWASDDINVLFPKFKINKYIAMFIITIIRNEKYRFSYGRKWHKERMEASMIKLPVTKDNEPDWCFMEKYIKSLPYSYNLEI
jgi:hypothetical protein